MTILNKIMEKFGLGSDKEVVLSPNLKSTMPRNLMQFMLKAEDPGGIFKAYIPEYLFNAPYGHPRKVNIPELKRLSRNPYVFSVIKTISDGAASTPWKIEVKEEFQDEEVEGAEDYKDKIKEVTRFFRNPNGNEESFSQLLRTLVTDICEVDSGVLVKVFDIDGTFKQLFARSGALFLKNPDIYGYIGNKADFVSPLPRAMQTVEVNFNEPTKLQDSLIKNYDTLFKNQAAYYQYGWTAGSFPIPFGTREIMYVMQNPRSDSMYGRSPIEMLHSVILNLVYGVEFNLDYYVNSNMPDGMISLLGANKDQLDQFRENFEDQFKFKDEFGKKRKVFNKIPVSGTEVKFTPFSLSSKDMEIIAQQQWFTKVLWMCFGVTADDMGFTEDSSKNVSESQVSVARRKALKPILENIAYHINTQILPEFFATGKNIPASGDVPLMFVFDEYEFDEDKKQHDILEQEIRMGVKTPEMAAKELGINVDELVEAKKEAMEQEVNQANAMNPQMAFGDENPKDEKKEAPKEKEKVKPKKEPEEKAKEDKQYVKELDNYFDGIGDAILNAMDKIPEDEFKD